MAWPYMEISSIIDKHFMHKNNWKTTSEHIVQKPTGNFARTSTCYRLNPENQKLEIWRRPWNEFILCQAAKITSSSSTDIRPLQGKGGEREVPHSRPKKFSGIFRQYFIFNKFVEQFDTRK